MAINKRSNSKIGSGCLVLFALPFAGVGVGVGAWLLSSFLTYLSARHWVDTRATILDTQLIESKGDDSTTYRVTASYRYKFGGQTYTGSRVGLTGGSDNLGSFQKNAYKELKGYLNSGEPFHCFVNPNRPDQAVLYRDLRWEMVAFQEIFVLTFGGVGFGMLIGGLVGSRNARRRAAAAAVHPEKPWMWRPDWAAGRIVFSSKTRMIVVVAIAVLWNVFSSPMLFVLPGEIVRKGNHWALLGLLFPLIGMCLIGVAVLYALKWLKYGQSEFQMADVPGAIGGQLAGVIRTSAKVRPEDGFHLELRCERQITTGSGDNRRTSKEILWKSEQTVMHELLEDQESLSAIPVVFQIPVGCPASSDEDPNYQTSWRLTATARAPGIGYSATFEVPVFKTGAFPKT